MATCGLCNGTTVCVGCGGTGSGKEVNTHPTAKLINPATGSVQCIECGGSGKCGECKGTGKVY